MWSKFAEKFLANPQRVHPNCERLKWKQNCATAELRFMPNYVLFGFKFRLELAHDLCWVFATAYGTLKWPIAFSFGTDKHVEIEGRRCWMCAGMSKLTGCVCAANRFKPRHFGHLICIIWNHVNDQRTALLCFALFNPAAAPSFCTFKGPLWHNN